MQEHKSGFVNILGKPNAGKSTLINQLIGTKLAIVSPKAQTTRHRILGILNEENLQIIFSDTPGLIVPAYKLQEKMMQKSTEALHDADVLLYLVDISEKNKTHALLDELKKTSIPLIVLLNKIDLSNTAILEEKTAYWAELLPNAEILPVSALLNANLDFLKKRIIQLLPTHPPYYPIEQWTDKPERFFVNETLREKILMMFDKEIPFSVEVSTERFKREERRIEIETTIYVERKSQKGIIIGHQGGNLSVLGKQTRIDLEKFFGEKIHLNLFVKIQKNWRRNDKDLKNFGYD